MKKQGNNNDLDLLGMALNGWWCEACGKYVLKSEAGHTEKVWLCRECAVTDLIPEDK